MTTEHRSIDHRQEEPTNGRERHPADGERDRTWSGHDTSDTSFVLLEGHERDELRERWDRLQARFVDDPRGATNEADELLQATLDRITRRWQDRHRTLRQRWDHDEASTEELRTTLKHYRDAFERLVTA